MVGQPGKIRANSKDWKEAKQVGTEDRIVKTVNTFMTYKAPGLDDIYPVCLQEGLDITIRYLTEVFRGSLSMGHTA